MRCSISEVRRVNNGLSETAKELISHSFGRRPHSIRRAIRASKERATVSFVSVGDHGSEDDEMFSLSNVDVIGDVVVELCNAGAGSPAALEPHAPLTIASRLPNTTLRRLFIPPTMTTTAMRVDRSLD